MTGNLGNMGGNSISNIDNPSRQRDAANKNYVDIIIMSTRTYINTKADDRVNKSGDQITGNLVWGYMKYGLVWVNT